MSKRQKFVLAAFVLLGGVVLSRLGLGQFLQWRYRVAIYALLAWVLTIWALRDEDFTGIEWLVLPILPVMFAIGGVLVFPLLPTGFDSIFSFPITTDASSILSLALRMLFLAVFTVGYYATVLTANIYNVAAVRNIQLIRVAHSVGFLIAVATALFFYVVIFAFHLSSFGNLILVFLVSLPLIFQSVWSVTLETRIGERTRNYSLLGALVLAEVAWVLSFWPISLSIVALFLTAIFYEMVGIAQYHFDERLNTRIAQEFILVVVAAFFITYFVAQWGG